MAATVSKLFTRDPPPDSPDRIGRSALAEAIAAEAEAAAVCAAAEAASGPAMEAVWAAERSVEAAKGALTRAKAETAQHLQNVARGAASGSPRLIRDARNALTDAEDALQAARDARDALETRLPETAEHRTSAKRRLETAALAVLKAEAAPLGATLVADLARAQREVALKGAALAWLVSRGAVAAGDVPAPGQEHKDSPFRQMVSGPAKLALARYHSPPVSWNGLIMGRTAEGAAPWQAALDALQRDADTPLPT